MIKSLTHDRGVDVILDMVAGSYVPRELTALADGGRIVVIALLPGAKAELNLNEVLRRRLTVTGSTLRPRPIEFKAKIAAQLKERVWPHLEDGRIKPVVHRVFSAAQAAEAHALMEEQHARRQDRIDLGSGRLTRSVLTRPTPRSKISSARFAHAA